MRNGKHVYYNIANFPIGVQFGYAAAFDTLVLGNLAEKGIDTLQLLAEPQAAKAGLRPGYIFEIFQATPSVKSNASRIEQSAFSSLEQNQCDSFKMINPLDDLENYMTYGYVSGDRIPNNAKDKQAVFDPSRMALSAAEDETAPPECTNCSIVNAGTDDNDDTAVIVSIAVLGVFVLGMLAFIIWVDCFSTTQQKLKYDELVGV